MSEKLLIAHCSPTLAGMKTGSLFLCKDACPHALARELKRLNRMLNPKGVFLCVLRVNAAGTLIYVYRPKQLAQDLFRPESLAILKRYGYRMGNVQQMVAQLAEHFSREEGFPHEIGLFLSYPPADVDGFIQNKGRNYKCCGIWKVYSDEALAQKLFGRYQKCTRIYTQKHMEGFPLLRLTVAA